MDASTGGARTALGVAYVVALLFAAILPFLAFGPTGLFVLAPTGLWLAPGLRARVRRAGNLTDGVVGWPGLTVLVCGAFSLAIMAVGGHGMAAAWLASGRGRRRPRGGSRQGRRGRQPARGVQAARATTLVSGRVAHPGDRRSLS